MVSDLKDPGAAFRAVSADDVLRVVEGNLRMAGKAEGVVRGSGFNASVAG